VTTRFTREELNKKLEISEGMVSLIERGSCPEWNTENTVNALRWRLEEINNQARHILEKVHEVYFR